MNALQLARGGWFGLLERLLLVVAGSLGCGSPRVPVAPAAVASAPAGPVAGLTAAEGEPLIEAEWARESRSPVWSGAGEVGLPGCPRYEQSLFAVARAVADRQAAGKTAWEVSDLVAQLRASGGPFVWPRSWTLQTSAFEPDQVQASLAGWLGHAPALGERRCGAARVKAADGSVVLAAVVVDALADLDPLPARARLGQWLRLRARLLVPIRSAETVLLGPRGAPRVIPTEVRPGEVRSVFNLDAPGLWRVQVVLGLDQGPRPALEAWLFVDEPPNQGALSAPAPGEPLAEGMTTATPEEVQRARLFDLLNEARRSEQRLPVRRDPRLDQLAQSHAEAMRMRQQTAHDVGQGLPSERLREAGIEPSLIGENVAHASTLGRAHRALWDSPAHRGTLLEPEFAAVGVGLATARDGVWVCELFANYRAHQ